VILKSGLIRFFKAENGIYNPGEWPDAELDGEIINVARDQRHQQFILILVKSKIREDYSRQFTRTKYEKKEIRYKLVLWIYTARHYE